MVDRAPDWNLYRTFLAVVRAGSFSAAARVLGTTQPTVGRQIEALEATLGTKLFTRSQRGLTPTPAASEVVRHAEAMDAAAAALRRTSTSEADQERGTVRVTAGAQFGVEVLPSMLARFSDQHPGIQLELSITSRTEDLLNRDSDIAVRLSRPTQQALVGRKIGKVKVGLYAHRTYVGTNGLPRSIAEVAKHRLIGFDRDMHILKAFGGLAEGLRREQFAYRTDNVNAQLALLRAGAGIAACHVHLACLDDELVPVLPNEVMFAREVWLIMHADMRRERGVRLLFDHLKRELTRYLQKSR